MAIGDRHQRTERHIIGVRKGDTVKVIAGPDRGNPLYLLMGASENRL